jgi:deazaflavin-dependent oxidoreductase (nitroreductase family)
MADVNDFNSGIIKEFRANGGQLGGPFEGAPMLLLTTTGAKSGKKHTNPLAYGTDGDRIVVFGTKGGAPTHPDWYHNLVAHPTATVEVGADSFEVEAKVAEGEERARIWERQKQLMPGFADYEKKTSRVIPVVALQRKS